MNVPTFESEASRDREIPAYDLGRVPYRTALEFQRRAVETRARGESPDVLYFVYGSNFANYGTDLYRYGR